MPAVRKLVFAAPLALTLGLTAPAHAAPAKTPTALSYKGNAVYELRIYDAMPGKFDALNARFRDHTLKLFAKHGMTSVAYWSEEGSANGRLVYVLAYPSREAREASWTAFRADPEWQAAQGASEANGKLVEKVTSSFMKMTDYSPALAVKP